jgi:hypothetical protein
LAAEPTFKRILLYSESNIPPTTSTAPTPGGNINDI